MQSIDYRTAKLINKDNESTRMHDLDKIAHRWDGGVRHELRLFAQLLWPDTRLMGMIPHHRYRLRKQIEGEMVVWWVERDIPPFDRYRCEAYCVELSLAEPAQPRLVVRSGISAYPVVPMSIEGLRVALVRVGVETPLVINRQFGPALDP